MICDLKTHFSISTRCRRDRLKWVHNLPDISDMWVSLVLEPWQTCELLFYEFSGLSFWVNSKLNILCILLLFEIRNFDYILNLLVFRVFSLYVFWVFGVFSLWYCNLVRPRKWRCARFWCFVFLCWLVSNLYSIHGDFFKTESYIFLKQREISNRL